MTLMQRAQDPLLSQSLVSDYYYCEGIGPTSLPSVAGTPTDATVTRTAATNVSVSWTASSTGPALGGYEVFYQTAAGSNGSSTTTTTELTLTGLMLGQTYSIFVVAFGPKGAPVLPSAHSNTEMISLSRFSGSQVVNDNNASIDIQPVHVTVTPSTFFIMVSWTAPQFITPDNYSIEVSCFRLCDSVPTLSGMLMIPHGGATNYTITPLEPNNLCTMRVIAMIGSTSGLSTEKVTTTLFAGLS